MKCLFDDVTDGTLSVRVERETEFMMNYFLFSLKTLYFYYSLMVFLSIYNIGVGQEWQNTIPDCLS